MEVQAPRSTHSQSAYISETSGIEESPNFMKLRDGKILKPPLRFVKSVRIKMADPNCPRCGEAVPADHFVVCKTCNITFHLECAVEAGPARDQALELDVSTRDFLCRVCEGCPSEVGPEPILIGRRALA